MTISITNNTSTAIPAVMTVNGQTQPAVELSGNATTFLTSIDPAGPAAQLTLQTFPAGASNLVWTLTISGNHSGSSSQIVGQILNGDG